MARPLNQRRVRANSLATTLFKPAGVPTRELKEVSLTFDQAEAIRLADMELLYQEAAARKMGVSRQTFGRILDEARRRIAEAILTGKALRIEGGHVTLHEESSMHKKVAVPTRGGLVDSHFGNCECFAIYELEGNTIKNEKRLDSPEGCGCKSDIASILAKDGVSLIIAGNMGEGAVRVLTANGIEVIRGTSGNTRSVVENWLSGLVKDSGEGCHEHGSEDCSAT